jgi:hypothetical protein
MAHRLILTLVALLTGLAAQIAPAEAAGRQAAPAQIAAVAMQAAVASASRAPAALAELPEPGMRHARAVAPLRSAPVSAPAPFTVLMQVDRAHE